jgi:hypothetical protein
MLFLTRTASLPRTDNLSQLEADFQDGGHLHCDNFGAQIE